MFIKSICKYLHTRSLIGKVHSENIHNTQITLSTQFVKAEKWQSLLQRNNIQMGEHFTSGATKTRQFLFVAEFYSIKIEERTKRNVRKLNEHAFSNSH